ncbi:uncharacterized protein BDV14DRAFT_84456 [Aspergillus stella-maris]|uniref:uncharacterized protein n=1 Tax=Aspergillus stella-maris TaxID=1810926 RepID=UPI003CCCF4FC
MTDDISVRCPLHTEFYVCGNGFRGCCAEDPCDTQLCLYGRDDQMSSSSAVPESGITAALTPSPTPATATAETTTTSSSSSTSSTSKTRTPSISTTQTSTSTTVVPEETTETQPTSAANAATSSKSQVNAGMIGGVVAGVIVLLLILCLVFFFIRWSRRKRWKRFTLVRWQCPRTGHAQANIEAGETGSTSSTQALVQPQPAPTAVNNIVTRPATAPNPRLRTIPEEQSPGTSPLQGSQTNSPHTVPSAVSPRKMIYPSPRRNSCSKAALFKPPDDIHPAFRQDNRRPSSLAAETDEILPAPVPIIRRVSSTPELSDTGFRLGRIELPETGSSRELINIPLAQRQQYNAQRQLYRNAELPSPIITPDGAVLSANFNSLPVDPDSHAMSFMDYGPESAGGRARGLRLSIISKRKSKAVSSPSPLSGQLSGPLSPPPPYRAEWRMGSKEVKEKMKEAFRRKS